MKQQPTKEPSQASEKTLLDQISEMRKLRKDIKDQVEDLFLGEWISKEIRDQLLELISSNENSPISSKHLEIIYKVGDLKRHLQLFYSGRDIYFLKDTEKGRSLYLIKKGDIKEVISTKDTESYIVIDITNCE